jgi:hypothetical protein
VVLRQPGVGVCDEADLGPPVYPPAGSVEVNRRGDVLTLDVSAPSGPGDRQRPDVVVGQLPVLGRDPETGTFVVHLLQMPTPEPFDDMGMEEMWQAACGLPPPIPASVRHQGLRPAGAVPTGWDELNKVDLPALSAIARHLVSHWPRRDVIHEIWRNVELPGGRENAARTSIRYRGPALGREGSAARLPVRSLRWATTDEPWRSQGVSRVAAEIVKRLAEREQAEGGETAELTSPLLAVAGLSASHARVDPPPSSWPWSLRCFYDAGLNVLASPALTGEGAMSVPLCHLWQLYETWVGASLLAELTRLYGEPTRGPEVTGINSQGGATWRATWTLDPGRMELWSQIEIGRVPKALPDGGGKAVVSVTGALIPDALLVVARPGKSRYLAFDAKHRRTRTMTGGEVAEAGSKYLWGLRDVATGQPVLDSVVLVSSGGGQGMFDPSLARIESRKAVPGSAPLELTLAELEP